MRYLDPKADLTFKRVFGEHADLLKSLLNSLLPLETEEQMIDTLEYLPAEQVPDNPMKKNSIVDVKCRDKTGRVFIVEMQMIWSEEFKQRVLFNASKAYVRQLNRSEDFELLQPVYALAIVNDIFEPDDDLCIRNYGLVEIENTDKVIDGLFLTFVELPKFQPHSMQEKKMAVLWLRYLTEINEDTRSVPQELLEQAETKKAIELVEQGAYTDAQMEWYDEFWDAVRVEKTLVNSAVRKGLAQGIEQGLAQGIEQGLAQGIEQGLAQGIEQGLAQGIEQGLAQGIEQGMAQGMAQGIMSVARNLKSVGMPVEEIIKVTGLSAGEVEEL